MDRRETATICAVLASAFPALTMSAETVEMWHAMLGDLNGNLVLRAVQDWVLTEERYPTIAGIRRTCATLAGVLAPSASEAWAEVKAVCEEYGIYAHNRPEWSHDLIRQTVKVLGYYHICQTDNIATVRAQFTKMYSELAEKSNSSVLRHEAFEISAPIVALPNSTAVEYSLTSQKALGESSKHD